MPQRAATLKAASPADCIPCLLTSGGFRAAPCTTSRPARCQAIVPSFRDTTLLGTPALISDSQALILGKMAPQLTTIVVSADGMSSAKRYTSSAPGTLIAVGMLL